MFKVNNRSTRIRWEICSKLTIILNAGWVNIDVRLTFNDHINEKIG